MQPEEPQVMEYDATTNEYTFRNFTPEEQADNDERALQIETP
jgi:hypothetical protein